MYRISLVEVIDVRDSWVTVMCAIWVRAAHGLGLIAQVDGPRPVWRRALRDARIGWRNQDIRTVVPKGQAFWQGFADVDVRIPMRVESMLG